MSDVVEVRFYPAKSSLTNDILDEYPGHLAGSRLEFCTTIKQFAASSASARLYLFADIPNEERSQFAVALRGLLATSHSPVVLVATPSSIPSDALPPTRISIVPYVRASTQVVSTMDLLREESGGSRWALGRELLRRAPLARKESKTKDLRSISGLVQLFLSELASPIHYKSDSFQDLFVFDTSRWETERLKSEHLPAPVDIARAVRELENFLSIQSTNPTRPRARLVVGERGAGKTTCVRMAIARAIEESRGADAGVMVLAIDHQTFRFAHSSLDETERLYKIYADISNSDQMRLPMMREITQRITRDDVEGLRTLAIDQQDTLVAILGDEAYMNSVWEHLHRLHGTQRPPSDDELNRRCTEVITDIRRDGRRCLLGAISTLRSARQADYCTWLADRVLDALSKPLHVTQAAALRAAQSLHADLVRKRLARGHATWHEVRALLLEIQTHSRVVVVFDNVDQRTNHLTETQLLREIDSVVSDYNSPLRLDAIVAVRNSTYCSHEFRKADIFIQDWRDAIHITPPDFLKVVTQRAKWLRQRGVGVGDRDWWYFDDVCELITQMADGSADSEFHSLARWVMNRHPFSVRDQLQAFARGLAAIFNLTPVRRGASALSRGPRRREFYLRALIVGPYSHYVDEGHESFAPIVFDNGFPASQFNALLIPWLLVALEPHRVFTRRDIAQLFERTNVPPQEVEHAIDVLKSHSVIREAYARSDGIDLSLTVWGEEFQRTWASLAYVQAVWWDVSMPSEFDLGPPRPLSATDLTAPIGVFSHWLYHEERLALTAIGAAPEFTMKRGGVAKTVTGQLLTDLRSIELSLPR